MRLHNLLFYKPPTSAHNILIIEELAFYQFCSICALVRLWVELTCIRRTKTYQPMMASTPDDGKHTGNISQFYEQCWFSRFSNHHQREDFPMKISGLTSMTETILWMQDLSFMKKWLENQLEIEGKVENTWIQSIASSQSSVDNFSNFKFDKRSEVCKCDR